MSQKENNKFQLISINFNKFLIGIIILAGLFLITNDALSWYDSNYSYRRVLTIENSQVATTSDAFVIVASTTQTWLKDTGQTGGRIEQGMGYDIIFVDDDDSTLLNYEYESYSSSTGSLVAWVETDISSTADKTIYMYYGYSGATDNATSGAVWADSGAVGVWHLSENPSGSAPQMQDSTNNSNHGTSAGSMTASDQVSGQLDGSLDFDGSDDYVEVTDHTNLKPNHVTVVAWIYPRSWASNDVIVAKENNAPPYTGYQLRYNGNDNLDFRVVVGGTGYSSQWTGTDPATNQWHQIVGTYDGETSRLYQNTTELVSNTNPSGNLQHTTDNISIGTSLNWINREFDGLIDEVRIYNIALTEADIITIYNMENDNASFLTFGSEETPVSAASGVLTIEGWVYPKTSVASKAIVVKNSEVRLFTDSSSKVNCQIHSGDSWLKAAVSTNALTLNTWQHVACTLNKKDIKVFINGIEQGSQAVGVDVANTSNVWHVGRDAGATYGYFQGVIDDVRIYSYDRTVKELVEDMNAGHPAIGSPVGSYVGYWPLDQGYGTTAYDKSIHKNDLTLTNADAWETGGKFAGCWNGTSTNWLSRADDADFDIAEADDFSISMWFKSDSATNPSYNEWLLAKNFTASATTAGYAVYADTSGNIVFGIDDDTTWDPDEVAGDIGTDYYDATWHHAVAVKTSTSSIEMYIDGVQTEINSSLSVDASLANAASLYIADNDGTDDADEFNGDIDEIAIYRFALSPADIRQLYNRGATLMLGAKSTESDGTSASNAASREYCIPGDTSTCRPPVGHWKLDEKAGTTAYDTSTSTNDGTLTGGPTWQSAASCHQGACLSFDGSDDTIQVPHDDSISPSGQISVSLWFNSESSGATQQLLRKGEWDSTKEYALELIDVSGQRRLTFKLRTTSEVLISEGVDVGNGWHFVVATYDGSNLRLYKNGLSIASPVVQTGSINDQSDDLWIGSFKNGSLYFDGLIDDVRIYDYARTQAQIAWDYNRGKPIAHWKMDEGQDTATTCDATGSTVYDYSYRCLEQSTCKNGIINNTGDSPATTSIWGPGKYNCGIYFDGTDDFVDVGDLAIDENLRSISFWLNASSTSESIIDLDGSYTIDVSSGTLDLNNTTTETIYVDGVQTTTLTTGWHNVVITIPATDTIDPDNADLGRVSSTYLQGMLDDVRFYTYPLTTVQIKQIYNEGAAIRFGPSSGLP